MEEIQERRWEIKGRELEREYYELKAEYGKLAKSAETETRRFRSEQHQFAETLRGLEREGKQLAEGGPIPGKRCSALPKHFEAVRKAEQVLGEGESRLAQIKTAQQNLQTKILSVKKRSEQVLEKLEAQKLIRAQRRERQGFEEVVEIATIRSHFKSASETTYKSRSSRKNLDEDLSHRVDGAPSRVRDPHEQIGPREISSLVGWAANYSDADQGQPGERRPQGVPEVGVGEISDDTPHHGRDRYRAFAQEVLEKAQGLLVKRGEGRTEISFVCRIGGQGDEIAVQLEHDGRERIRITLGAEKALYRMIKQRKQEIVRELNLAGLQIAELKIDSLHDAQIELMSRAR